MSPLASARPIPGLRGDGPTATRLMLAGRLIFGAWMLAQGANHFALHLWSEPAGSTPGAVQLMSALVHSGLFDVAMGVQLVAGALFLAGLFVPLALCVVLPVNVCAAYWAVMLEQAPMGALIALAAVALNGLLMLARLGSYRDMLVRHARTLGEPELTFERLYVDPRGRTARGDFVRGLIPLGLAAAFYHLWVIGGSGEYAMLVLLFPAIILHARRLRDMGQSVGLLLIPAVPTGAAAWFHMFNRGQAVETPIVWTALAVGGAFTVWGLVAPGRRAER